jgi:hypothetical protein
MEIVSLVAMQAFVQDQPDIDEGLLTVSFQESKTIGSSSERSFGNLCRLTDAALAGRSRRALPSHTQRWRGVVWCGVVWCGVVWCVHRCTESQCND